MVAAGLCGLAGAALAPIQSVQPGMGQSLIFKAFALVVIGGLGQHGRRARRRCPARPDRELDRRLHSRSSGRKRRLYAHDRDRAPAPGGLFERTRDARRMKLALRRDRARRAGAPCRSSSIRITSVGIAISGFIFVVCAAGAQPGLRLRRAAVVRAARLLGHRRLRRGDRMVDGHWQFLRWAFWLPG